MKSTPILEENKKSHQRFMVKKQSEDTIKEKLKASLILQKLGGSATTFANPYGRTVIAKQNEALFHTTDFDAIGYTQDNNSYNDYFLNSGHPVHSSSPILQAIFLRNEYLRATGTTLPIFEYSSTHDFIELREFSSDEVIELWCALCGDYIQQQIDDRNDEILTLSIKDLKTLAMYKKPGNFATDVYGPADSNYDPALSAEIDKRITELRREKIAAKEKISQDILTRSEITIFDPKIYRDLLSSSALRENDAINQKINDELKNSMISIDSQIKIDFDTFNTFDIDKVLILLMDDQKSCLNILYPMKIFQIYFLAEKMHLDDIVKGFRTITKATIKDIIKNLKNALPNKALDIGSDFSVELKLSNSNIKKGKTSQNTDPDIGNDSSNEMQLFSDSKDMLQLSASNIKKGKTSQNTDPDIGNDSSNEMQLFSDSKDMLQLSTLNVKKGKTSKNTDFYLEDDSSAKLKLFLKSKNELRLLSSNVKDEIRDYLIEIKKLFFIAKIFQIPLNNKCSKLAKRIVNYLLQKKDWHGIAMLLKSLPESAIPPLAKILTPAVRDIEDNDIYYDKGLYGFLQLAKFLEISETKKSGCYC